MNKLIPFSKFSKKPDVISSLSDTSVVVDEKGVPLGFVFGRDSFVSFLEHIDTEFEKNVKDQKKAYNNPAGKLIDLIEEKLSISPDLVKDLKSSLGKKTEWIPLEKIVQSLHV
ncbi:MAG TPA: hypothetical protein VNA13_02030 [Xanthomonadales bacterium]|nr:hypothetical protein [Xanthomonadales bacterium]